MENPKSNVRNTARAEVRVKRCSRNAARGRGSGWEEGEEDRERIFGTLNSWGTGSEISPFGEITEESYVHFASAARRVAGNSVSDSRSHCHHRRILVLPPSLLPVVVLSSALRALECSISDTRTALNPAQ